MHISTLSTWFVVVLVSVTSAARPSVLLTEEDLDNLGSLGSSEALAITGEESLLAPLLIPRLPGTRSHKQAQDHIIGVLESLRWTVELRTHREMTPMGELPFTNILASPFPIAPGQKRAIFAAHYDSKHFPGQEFIGATDSAVSCAILLDIARTLAPMYAVGAADREAPALQLVFFDGEEAFVKWTREDSLYGSRRLAEEWEQEGRLQDIEIFVLLDLLGFRDQKIPNLQPATDREYEVLRLISNRMNAKGLLSGGMEESLEEASFFTADKNGWRMGMDDDHRPFFERGVRCLHAITYPFPSFWHEIEDDASAVDAETTWDTNLIFRAFAATMTGLGGGRTLVNWGIAREEL